MVIPPPDTSRDLVNSDSCYRVLTGGTAKTEFEAALALVFEDFYWGLSGFTIEVDDFGKHYDKVARALTIRLSGGDEPRILEVGCLSSRNNDPEQRTIIPSKEQVRKGSSAPLAMHYSTASEATGCYTQLLPVRFVSHPVASLAVL